MAASALEQPSGNGKWQAAKPKNVSAPEPEAEDTEKTKDEWNTVGTAVAAIQSVGRYGTA